MKKITLKELKAMKACKDGVEWFKSQGTEDAKELLVRAHNNLSALRYCMWFLTRKMTVKQKLKDAIFAAEKVVSVYEKQYPNDPRPREAIEAAKKYLEARIKSKKQSTEAAACAAEAAYAAYAAADYAAILAAARAAARAADYAAYASADYAAADVAAYETLFGIVSFAFNLVFEDEDDNGRKYKIKVGGRGFGKDIAQKNYKQEKTK